MQSLVVFVAVIALAHAGVYKKTEVEHSQNPAGFAYKTVEEKSVPAVYAAPYAGYAPNFYSAGYYGGFPYGYGSQVAAPAVKTVYKYDAPAPVELSTAYKYEEKVVPAFAAPAPYSYEGPAPVAYKYEGPAPVAYKYEGPAPVAYKYEEKVVPAPVLPAQVAYKYVETAPKPAFVSYQAAKPYYYAAPAASFYSGYKYNAPVVGYAPYSPKFAAPTFYSGAAPFYGYNYGYGYPSYK